MGKIKRPKFENFSIYLLLSGVMMAANILLYIKAMSLTSLANAAFILYLAPIIAIILAYFILGETLRLINIVIFVISFFGFYLLIDVSIDGNLEGNMYSLAAAICYGFFIVLNRKISDHIASLDRTMYQFFFGSLILLPFLVFIDVNINMMDALWLGGVGFFQGFVALTLLVTAIKYLTAIEYGTISYLEPVTAALIGFFLYFEEIGFLQILGCVLISISGIALTYFNDRKGYVANS